MVTANFGASISAQAKQKDCGVTVGRFFKNPVAIYEFHGGDRVTIRQPIPSMYGIFTHIWRHFVDIP